MLHRQARAASVIDVDVGHRAAAARAATEHDPDPAAVEPLGKRIVAVERHHEHAVHVAGGQVAFEPRLIGCRLRHQQYQLQEPAGEDLADAPHEPREEWVTEEESGGLGDDQADRVGPTGDERARRAVGYVAQLFGRPLDRPFGLAADSRTRGEDPGRGGARDAGEFRDFLERRIRDRLWERSHSVLVHSSGGFVKI